VPATPRRGREARRGLSQPAARPLAVRHDRDDLLDQREAAGAYAAITPGSGSRGGDQHPSGWQRLFGSSIQPPAGRPPAGTEPRRAAGAGGLGAAVTSDQVKGNLNPRTNLIYVADDASEAVSVISGRTNKTIATIALGRRSVGIAVNPRTNVIYVTNYVSNTLSVISGRTNKVTATIRRVGSFPRELPSTR
jgi:YVTN family beta-propeller protein